MSDAEQPLEPVHLPQPVVLLGRLRVQWAVGAVLIGALSALCAALVRLFFSHLQWLFTGSTSAPPVAGAHLVPWRRTLTPLAGALLAMVVLSLRTRRAHRLGREPRPYVEYVEAVRHCGGEIPLVPNCWRTLSAAFSIATGAAVGREGSMIQFAAAAAAWCGKRLRGPLGGREPLDLRLLVACGVAGGVTAAYSAPLAAVFFAAEIVLGATDWRELPLLALAAGAGRLASGPLLGWERLYPAHISLHSLLAQRWLLLFLPVLAMLYGIGGPLYQRLIRSLRSLGRWPFALVAAGLVTGLLSVRDPRVWGNGDLGLSAALGHAALPGLSIAVPALALLLCLRLLATTISVGTGTVGGVFTPTLFAGGATGALCAHLVQHALPSTDTTLWAIAGMSLLMASVTHAPTMAALMAAELTGNWLLFPVLFPLNLVAWRVAHRLSPDALYAIASQSPGTSARDVKGSEQPLKKVDLRTRTRHIRVEDQASPGQGKV